MFVQVTFSCICYIADGTCKFFFIVGLFVLYQTPFVFEHFLTFFTLENLVWFFGIRMKFVGMALQSIGSMECDIAYGACKFFVIMAFLMSDKVSFLLESKITLFADD